MYRKIKNDAERLEQEELDIRCLQLIRAALHNEERKLPEDWEEDPQEHRKYAFNIFIFCLLLILFIKFYSRSFTNFNDFLNSIY